VQGFLNLNKPAGITSHDCVARVRRLLRIKRVGHGGTLDPAATGVLPIALGCATRLLQYMQQDKAYRATIRFGVTTATDDLEGEILTAAPAPHLTPDTVKAALGQFLGTIEQVPPAYSAIQVGGKRLYDLARKGIPVEVPARQVQVHNIEILDWRPADFPEIDLEIACGPGTYIRAIARDLGAALQTGGTLARLTRTFSSGFTLEDSLTFDALSEQLEEGRFEPVPPAAALAHLAAVNLPVAAARKWCQGQKIFDFTFSIVLPEQDKIPESANSSESNPQMPNPKSQIQNPKLPLRVYREDGLFLGVGELANSETEPALIPVVVFAPLP
jgi:tRNA pseudouridine55 synthase